MKKSINSCKKLEEFKFLIIFSVFVLTLLAIHPEVGYSHGIGSGHNLEFSQRIGLIPEQIFTRTLEELDSFGFNLSFYRDSKPIQILNQYTAILYAFGGTGAAILIIFISRRLNKSSLKFVNFDNIPGKYENLSSGENVNYPESKFSDNIPSQKPWEEADTDEKDKGKTSVGRIRLYTVIPALFIALAEILIFFNITGIAVWMHIGILTALTLSNMFIRDAEINKIHQALMLLPVLRLVNLSMPVFFTTTLYTFIFIYAPLAIPVAVIIMHQKSSYEEIGISLKHIAGYIILSIPLGFLLGLGEYLTIQPEYLIPDLSFENLLKLTIIMIFFVGLVEELIFRSILQTRLEQALSSKEALLITSILFGLMHSGYGTFYEILYTGFVGLFIGFCFYKTRSLPFVAVLHGCVNVFLFGIFPLL